jgi:hypothetical protein
MLTGNCEWQCLEKWLCRNCKEKQHQCYICGKLGASDEALKNKRQVILTTVHLQEVILVILLLSREYTPVEHLPSELGT